MKDQRSPEILKGIIENVVYRNEQNEYTVLEVVDSEDNLVCAVGIIPMASEGEHVSLYGRWVYHKEYGKQFAFDSFEKTLPEDSDGIFQYLSSGTIKGVGPVTALKLKTGKSCLPAIPATMKVCWYLLSKMPICC